MPLSEGSGCMVLARSARQGQLGQIRGDGHRNGLVLILTSKLGKGEWCNATIIGRQLANAGVHYVIRTPIAKIVSHCV